MPFQSYKQMAWLKHNRPDIYGKWKAEHGLAIGGRAKLPGLKSLKLTQPNSTFEQKKDYTCGPSSVRFTLAEQGVDISEQEIQKATGTTSNGVDPTPLANYVKSLGFDVQQTQGNDPDQTLQQLDQQKQSGASIIVDYLSGDKLSDGHYAVFEGLEGNRVHIFNPANGRFEAIEKPNFIAHWLDTTIAGKPYKYYAMIITKTQ